MSLDQNSGTSRGDPTTPADGTSNVSTELAREEIRETMSRYYRISTRRYRAMGDPDWEEWAAIAKGVGLGPLVEMRTVDGHFNPAVEESGSYLLNGPDEAWERLDLLPTPKGDREYYLLVFDAVRHPAVDDPHFRLLGYDVSDETMTSSLMNCGSWNGELGSIAQRSQMNGLLTWDDAREAQRILPRVWNGDPHSHVFVWAMYEFIPGLR